MPPRRLTIAEKIDQLREAGEAQIFEQFEALEHESVEYRGLRFNAKRTQLGQDRILSLYHDYVRVVEQLDLGEEPSKEELNAVCFPQDFETLYKRARRFIIYLIAVATPRSTQDTHITYHTASGYRKHFLFWVRHTYQKRQVEPPRPAILYNEMTEAMRGAAMSRRLGKASTSKAYIGLPEIQYMIDLDMRATPCIEYTEQHHLAWCIGRVTALRNGSFGPPPPKVRPEPGPDGYEDFIMWKDVQIKRSGPPGHFEMKLKIRNLKTNRVDPAAEGHKELNFQILSPQTQANIPFSVPHRLLAIALRRGALQDIDDIDQLFAGDRANILIKNSFLNQPIFIAGSHRGLSLTQDTPLPASALTPYIRIRGQRAGFPDIITFYSIRRRLATDLVAAYGLDAAREIMGHAPNSRLLEEYYLEFNAMRNTTAVGLGEDAEAQETERRAALHRQILERIDESLLAKSRGPALNTLVQQALSVDDEFNKLEDPNDIKNYTRRTRGMVLNTLWDELRIEAAQTLTQDEVQKRKEDIFDKASAFAQRVLDRVRMAKAAAPAPATDPTSPSVSVTFESINLDEPFPEFQQITEPEDDVEDRAVGDSNIIQTTADEGEDDEEVHADQTSSYEEVAKAFMDIMLTNSLSTYAPNEKIKCPLCLDDPTVSQQDKDHERMMVHHRAHLTAPFHSEFQQFRRSVVISVAEKAEETGQKARYECPFCQEVAPDDVDEIQSFHRFDYLARHIEASTDEMIDGHGEWKMDTSAIRDHNLLKQDGGWYDEEFRGSIESQVAKAKSRKSDAQGAGVRWERNNVELPKGVPLPGRPSLVQGGPSLTTDEILAKYPGALTKDEPSAATFPTPRQMRFLTTDDPQYDPTDDFPNALTKKRKARE